MTERSRPHTEGVLSRKGTKDSIRAGQEARRNFLKIIISHHPDWKHQQLADFLGISKSVIGSDLAYLNRSLSAAKQRSEQTKQQQSPHEKLFKEIIDQNPEWTIDQVFEEVK